MRRSERLDIAVPRVTLEPGKRADSRGKRLSAPAIVAQMVCENRRERAAANRDVIEPHGALFRSKPLDKRLGAFNGAAAVCDQVEIVGAGPTSAQKFETGQPRQATVRERQRRNPNQPTRGRPQRQQTQGPCAPKMCPPGIQPFPRHERAIRSAFAEQLGPLGAQLAEVLDVVDHDNLQRSGLDYVRPQEFRGRHRSS